MSQTEKAGQHQVEERKQKENVLLLGVIAKASVPISLLQKQQLAKLTCGGSSPGRMKEKRREKCCMSISSETDIRKTHG